jgi:hypothetical protein
VTRTELLDLARKIVDDAGGSGFGIEILEYTEENAVMVLSGSGFQVELLLRHAPGGTSGLSVRQKLENSLGAAVRGRLGYLKDRES